MSNNNISARELLEFSRSLPEPMDRETWENTPRCNGCRKLLTPENVHVVRGGLRPALDSLCSECWEFYRDLVPLVCVNCWTVVCRIEPHVDRRTGFKFERGRVYHVEECTECTSRLHHNDVVPVSIIELTQYRKQLGKKD